MNKKIMKPQLVHIKLKNFSFELSKKKTKGKIVKIRIIGPLISMPKAKEIQ